MTMKLKPFTWEAYSAEFDRDPDFDLFAKFSFDHLSQAECNEIRFRMRRAGDSLMAEAEALEADFKARQRSHLTVIDGGAP